MPNLPSSAQYMNDLQVAQDKPVTENLMSQIGSNINYLLDQDTTQASQIATLQAAYNQQELSFGPISASLVSSSNGQIDTAMVTYTNIRGRPVMIVFTSGAYQATATSLGAYGRLQILRAGSPITVIMSASGLGPGIYSNDWGTLGNALGQTGDIDGVTPGVQSAGAYMMHTGGSMAFFDNPGAGTHTYALRVSTVGTANSIATSISGFVLEL